MTDINPDEIRTPTNASAIQRYVDGVSRELWTMLPGKVTAYDPETQKATVLPLIRIPTPAAALQDNPSDEEIMTELPPLTDVPVVFPRAKGVTVYFPIYPESRVMLFFCARSLDKFVATAATDTIDPQDPRHHDLGDAVAVPGLYPFVDAIPDLDDDDVRVILESQHGKRVEFGLGGDTGDLWLIPSEGAVVQVGAKEAAEKQVLGETAIAKLEVLAQAFVDNATAFVQTGVGPGTLSPVVVTALETFIDELASWLAQNAKVT